MERGGGGAKQHDEGHAGARHGIPYAVLVRASFGTAGARLPALARALVACGWYGIQTWIGGEALLTLLGVLIAAGGIPLRDAIAAVLAGGPHAELGRPAPAGRRRPAGRAAGGGRGGRSGAPRRRTCMGEVSLLPAPDELPAPVLLAASPGLSG